MAGTIANVRKFSAWMGQVSIKREVGKVAIHSPPSTSRALARFSPLPHPRAHHCGIHQSNHSSRNLSNEDDEEDGKELSGKQGNTF